MKKKLSHKEKTPMLNHMVAVISTVDVNEFGSEEDHVLLIKLKTQVLNYIDGLKYTNNREENDE